MHEIYRRSYSRVKVNAIFREKACTSTKPGQGARERTCCKAGELPREELRSGDLEPVDSLAAVFGDVDVAFAVHRDAVRLIELSGKAAGTAKTSQVSSARPLDHVDLPVVLVDDEHHP